MSWKKLGTLIFSIMVPEAVGIISGVITSGSVTSWYLRLNKPFFNPPNFLFAPVWTILFALMGISFYLIWTTKATKKKKDTAIIIYAAQLFLNFLWSFLFFGLHNPLIAFIDIILLLGLIFCMIIVFFKINKTAGLLQIPYALWVSFASILNLYIYLLN